MSTASPLPLQPLPCSTVSEEEQHLLRQQVSARLQEHRRRRPQDGNLPQGQAQAALPGLDRAPARAPAAVRRQSRVADSVAARFAGSVSYREFLAQEAEAAMRQAEAAAEVARRSAEAIADAQLRLLEEIDQWNRTGKGSEESVDAAPSMVPSEIPLTVRFPADAVPPLDATPLTAAADAGSAHAGGTAAPGKGADARRSGQRELAGQSSTAEAMLVSTAVRLPEAVRLPQAVRLPEFVEPALPEPPPEPTVALPTNLIEFPRQLVAARKARPRLAEGPLREDADAAPERAQLRIFEVEADAFSTVPAAASESVLPEWSSIRLDSWLEPHDTTQPQAQVSVTLPLHTAPVSQRVMALGVDLCCVGAAFLLAVAAAAYAAPELPSGKFALMAAAGTLVLFGVLFLLLCFTFSDATPGMRYARIGLCTFNDENPTRSAMRRRLFAMVLSAVPMGLGFAWAMLDDDRLSWHDRISRIYQRAY